jgi:predicted metal-binding membrane protein
MNNDQPTYVYDTIKPSSNQAEDSIGPAILLLGGLATAGVWFNALVKWVQVVAADPVSRPYEAVLVGIMACVAAYYAWRTVRMACLMTCALCFLTYDSARKIRNYFHRKGKHE